MDSEWLLRLLALLDRCKDFTIIRSLIHLFVHNVLFNVPNVLFDFDFLIWIVSALFFASFHMVDRVRWSRSFGEGAFKVFDALLGKCLIWRSHGDILGFFCLLAVLLLGLWGSELILLSIDSPLD